MAYNRNFFKVQKEQSTKSAQVIVPLVLEYFSIKSVVDYGCGTGSWLKAFQESGITDMKGYDGPWVESIDLLIPEENFTRCELNKMTSPERKFDLAVSLEVAEHLPESSAEQFIELLTQSSDFVLFSAAIPYQGGTHHINEQWPEYWCEKFSKRGFEVIDCIRPLVWNNDAVDFWFAQNILLFVKRGVVITHPKLIEFKAQTNPNFLTRIHPKHYLKMAGLFQKLKNLKKFNFF
jgi:hypothetical protein